MKKNLRVEWITFSKTDPVTQGIWDQTFISDVLDSLKHYQSDRVVVILNGSTNYDRAKEINNYLSQFEKVLVIITSDENSLFDTECFSHPDIIIYSQYPTEEKSKNVDFWLPISYTPHIRQTLKENGIPKKKEYDWFFSGQVTHESREKLAEKLETLENGYLFKSKGFTQGLNKKEYGKLLAKSKIVPSPSGAVKPEAFRTYEALEAGCVPIPQGREYHRKMFDDSIFVYLEEWDNVKGYIENYSQRYPKINNVAQSWWLQQKRNIRQRFIKDLKIEQKNVTVLISTSPISTNPSTEVIEKSIESIKKQLPGCEIIIMADGVRNEQSNFDSDYQEFLRRILWKCNLEWENVLCVVYEEHLHQLEMTRKTLEIVTTDLVAFVEHDMLFHDKKIDWYNILKLLRTDKIDVMRFYFDKALEKLHSHIMLEMEPIEIDSVPLIRTAQWSQRPHIAKTEKYRQILRTYASERANCMIEDAIHGKIASLYDEKGKAGWNENKIAIYAPGDDYSFAYHIDGRGDESKYEEKQIF